LATIGIAATVFGHETQTSITGFIGSAHTVTGLLKQSPPRVEEAIEEMEVAIDYAAKVSAWGAFALTRIQRDKRRRTKVNIKRIADGLIRELKPSLDALNINIEPKINQIEGRAFAMDVEAVLINLLTNAYEACQQGRRSRIIKVEVGPKKEGDAAGFEIIVADSGPGVAKEFRERIWEPMFSTRTNGEGKQIGTGLGLAIVQSVVDDLNGIRRLDNDPELRGARFSIWLPLV
jgi:signal transduction histidine kinase